MSWFSRSVSFLQRKDEPQEESDELGTAEIEEEEEKNEIQVKAKLSSGTGVEDLSELTKNITRQLWGVASFLAPTPSSKFDDPSSEDELSPQFHEQKLFGPELETISITEDKPLKSKLEAVQSENQPMVDILSEADYDSSQRGTVQLDSSNPVSKQSSMEPRISGIRSDLAELKGGFAKGLSHISSVIRVVIGEDLLVSSPSEATDFEMNHLQQHHVQAIEYTSRRLAALKIELCPHYMREEHFWKIYFALLHSCLKKENSLLLAAPQVMY
ncbi:hypothetical protein O6H91_02G130800 [Diphasiastrum complanatum]|uniref:Uncharacterized protein n=1 Tax=Diphasiastrum complanatum TaxID=34168 RepID=A0ACC2EKS3_DIPCM|nr:hypothetical protein O6H91_02G130800 [Diphasiastrum complanatum]